MPGPPRLVHPMIVYKLTSLVNGKAYIGITTRRFALRWKAHRGAARRGAVQIISRAIAKHGPDSFRREVLCECATRAELLVCERALIAEHGTLAPRGYNMTAGGEGTYGRVITEEMRKQQSDSVKRAIAEGRLKPPSNKGRKMSDESRALMRVSGKGKNLGRKMSREAVAKQVAARTGAKRTPEMVARIKSGVRAGSHIKIGDEQAAQIKVLLSDGNFTNASIARMYGISGSAVWKVSSGRAWADVPMENAL